MGKDVKLDYQIAIKYFDEASKEIKKAENMKKSLEQMIQTQSISSLTECLICKKKENLSTCDRCKKKKK